MQTEAQEQSLVVEWCDWKRIPIIHIPNGGSRNVVEAANLKRQGVKAGVPDLMVPVARNGFHGLFIEMKRERGGRVSAGQREWLDRLSRNGYLAGVCHGSKDAIRLIEEYLG